MFDRVGIFIVHSIFVESVHNIRPFSASADPTVSCYMHWCPMSLVPGLQLASAGRGFSPPTSMQFRFLYN
jgi:hypothetical protein